MNKELERLKDYITSRPIVRCERSVLGEYRYVEIDTIAITQIFNYIDNSVPKEVIESELKYKENKLRQLDNDRYRKMCLQIEIDLLQKLLEGEVNGERKDNRTIKK